MDQTNAERQRRYIGRLKANAATPADVTNTDAARIRELEAEVARLRNAPSTKPKQHQDKLDDEAATPVEQIMDRARNLSRAELRQTHKQIGQLLKSGDFVPQQTTQDHSLRTLLENLAPIVKDLKAEGRKNMATMAPHQVAYLAGLLQILLDEWAE